MKTMLSWNVNGIRAVEKKGFLDFLRSSKPHILAVQETKAWSEQLSPALLNPPGYKSFWSRCERKGYSGVGVFAAEEPLKVSYGFSGNDPEGRVVLLEYPQYTFAGIYFPNGGAGPERLKYKLDFYAQFLDFSKKLFKKQKKFIVCGDFNTAHKPIDLARPKENEDVSGFLPEERAWLDKFMEAGFVDSFRMFNAKPEQYTWWDMKTRARERNVGWRLDYFMVDTSSAKLLGNAFIMPDVYGSDHCPIGIDINV